MAAKEPKVGSSAWWADIRGAKPQATKRTQEPTTKKKAPSREVPAKKSAVGQEDVCKAVGKEYVAAVAPFKKERESLRAEYAALKCWKDDSAACTKNMKRSDLNSRKRGQIHDSFLAKARPCFDDIYGALRSEYLPGRKKAVEEAPVKKVSGKSSGREGINVPQFCPVTGHELRPLFVAKKGAPVDRVVSSRAASKKQAVQEKKAALKKALAAPTKPTTCRDSVDAFGAAFGLYLETSSPAALAKAKAAQAKALSCGEKPSTLRDWANEIGDRVMEDEWVDMRGKFWMPSSKSSSLAGVSKAKKETPSRADGATNEYGLTWFEWRIAARMQDFLHTPPGAYTGWKNGEDPTEWRAFLEKERNKRMDKERSKR